MKVPLKAVLSGGVPVPPDKRLPVTAFSFDTVETFCLFLGTPHSGHSLIGALLNAHPDAVIAHELDVLETIAQNPSRDELFQLLLMQDQEFAATGYHYHGYDYAVPGQWQGRHQTLKCIGDKKGGRSSIRLLEHPALFDRLQARVGVPIKIIHMVRNPFDNICTMSRRANIPLERAKALYFRMCQGVHNTKQAIKPENWITIYQEDFIINPTEHLRALFTFLNLEAGEDLIGCCAKIVFDSPSKSRLHCEWTAELIAEIQFAVQMLPFFKARDYGVNG